MKKNKQSNFINLFKEKNKQKTLDNYEKKQLEYEIN